jgi:cell shape-determining protein MreC
MATKKSKIVVDNIMKVIDVPVQCVSSLTVKFLKQYFLSYTDNEGLKENLFRITMDQDELDEFIEETIYSESELTTIKSEIEELQKVAAKKDAAYVRFISHFNQQN